MRCPNPNCGAVSTQGSPCWYCGTIVIPGGGMASIDPILKMRRKVRDDLNKANAEVVMKVAEFMKGLD